ncbi:MAG: tetratricopeptide repeat protein [Saprospiraceae bacterium]
MSRSKKTSRKKADTRPPKAKKQTGITLPDWMSNRGLHLAVIFGLTCILYANTLFNDYALDDAIVITDNMYTQEGISGIPGILGKDTFYGFFKEEGKAQLVAGGRYRPLSLILFAIEYQLFGQQAWIGHLMNILYFGLTGVLLYLLLLQLFQIRFAKDYAYFVALVSALIFVAHPIHTEAVANIKGRDEILSLLGSLSALYFSLRAFLEKKPLLNIVAGGLFFLGLLSKENAITFLAIVPLSYYLFTKISVGQQVKQLGPFALVAILFLVIRFSILGGFSLGDPPMELMNNPFLKIVGDQWMPFTFAEKLATIFYTLGKYILLLIFPHPLTHDYYPQQIYLMSWGDPMVLLSLVVYLGLAVYGIIRLMKRDPLSYGILFYLITLSIVSNILFPVGTNMSERLIFMPSVGFCIVLAILAWRLIKRAQKNFTPTVAGLGLIVMLFGLKTVLRNPAWKDNFTLFSTDIYHSPNSAKLRNAMGGELLTQSLQVADENTQKEMWQEAAGHLNEALHLHPTYKGAYLLLGNAYNYLQQYEQSIAAYQKAINISNNDDDELAQNNLAITYRDAGKYAGEKQGDLNKALQYLQLADQLRPNEYETLRLLGVANGMGGRQQQAIDYFSRAAELEPNNADAWFNLGAAYMQAGQVEAGQRYLDKAREIDPEVEQKRNQSN